jgi:hypothetical protein
MPPLSAETPNVTTHCSHPSYHDGLLHKQISEKHCKLLNPEVLLD